MKKVNEYKITIVKKEDKRGKSTVLIFNDKGECDEDMAKMIINNLLDKIKRVRLQ